MKVAPLHFFAASLFKDRSNLRQVAYTHIRPLPPKGRTASAPTHSRGQVRAWLRRSAGDSATSTSIGTSIRTSIATSILGVKLTTSSLKACRTRRAPPTRAPQARRAAPHVAQVAASNSAGARARARRVIAATASRRMRRPARARATRRLARRAIATRRLSTLCRSRAAAKRRRRGRSGTPRQRGAATLAAAARRARARTHAHAHSRAWRTHAHEKNPTGGARATARGSAAAGGAAVLWAAKAPRCAGSVRARASRALHVHAQLARALYRAGAHFPLPSTRQARAPRCLATAPQAAAPRQTQALLSRLALPKCGALEHARAHSRARTRKQPGSSTSPAAEAAPRR